MCQNSNNRARKKRTRISLSVFATFGVIAKSSSHKKSPAGVPGGLLLFMVFYPSAESVQIFSVNVGVKQF
jgi:hypothetical protein